MDREKSELSGDINLGSCDLHVLHGVFKTGVEATGCEIKMLLIGLFQLFHDSPARGSDYLKVTGSTADPKMFCATKWLEDASVADNTLGQYCKNVLILEESSRIEAP